MFIHACRDFGLLGEYIEMFAHKNQVELIPDHRECCDNMPIKCNTMGETDKSLQSTFDQGN